MRKNTYRKTGRRITAGGLRPLPGQKAPRTIVLMQPKRFGIDIDTVVSAINAAENPDFCRRVKLYDLYADILMDAHLTAVINKRKSAVLCTPVEFHRDGVPDKEICEMLRSPWFYRFRNDAMDALFWGFTLVQFHRDGQWPDYFLVPRKHVDPVREEIFRHQTDITGEPWAEYDDLLFAGSRTDLGLLAQAAPYVVYKRNTLADWAQFSEVFGMPVREYLYDANDPEARAQILNDAYNEGGAGVYVHPRESDMKFVESSNKTASADLYDRLTERCNAEISKLILGNTLTTEASDKGTQALGTVHRKVEDRLVQADRKYLLDLLNYEMTDIFSAMGIDTSGGEFLFKEPKDIDLNQRMDIASKMDALGLPLDEEQLYEETGFRKPSDYERRKQERREAVQPAPIPMPVSGGGKPEKPDDPEEDKAKGMFKALKRFFGQAPRGEGALGW